MTYYITYDQTFDGATTRYTKWTTEAMEVAQMMTTIAKHPDCLQLVEITTTEC